MINYTCFQKYINVSALSLNDDFLELCDVTHDK